MEAPFPTEFGEFRLYAFEDSTAQELHLALVKGKIDPNKPMLVTGARAEHVGGRTRWDPGSRLAIARYHAYRQQGR